ncbi:hypothetical protein ABTZ03_24185 [Kitasatospora sp. NPDC096077]|uniref:hypothetical protein n=1 Tax=Kitasatospora sp. NPDC096077 TaxID=3155544 RepID=UPI0033270F2A
MVKHRSSTRIAARLASLAVAVGLVVLPQVGASASAANAPRVGTHQSAGGVTGPGGRQHIDEWNGTGAWCVSCVKRHGS